MIGGTGEKRREDIGRVEGRHDYSTGSRGIYKRRA